MIYTMNKRNEISTLLPPQARMALVEAGRAQDMVAINAAHRYARAAHPEHFNMGDDSHATKEPRQADEK